MNTDTRYQYPAEGSDPGKIRDLVTQDRWSVLEGQWNPYARQIYDNYRMIEGRHWDVWIPSRQTFVDVSQALDEDDLRYLQRPVMNWIGYWHHSTVAKLTENPPVISFVPATGDESDADLAEIMDPVFKYLWKVCDMDHYFREFVSLVVAAGSAVIKAWWDPDGGEVWEARGPAPYHVLDEYGMPVASPGGGPEVKIAGDAPFRMDGDEPVPMIEPVAGGGYREIGGAQRIPQGQIAVRVLSPVAVRTSAEPVPFHRKRWYVERTAMHVQEIYERYGKELDDEVGGEAEFRYSGHWGAHGVPVNHAFSGASDSGMPEQHDLVSVYELWEQPREQAPDGRHIVCTRDTLLHDGPNPYAPTFRPYERADFMSIPSRMMGKSPVEDLAPMNRVYNRGWGQILEHRNLMLNPLWLVDSASGIGKVSNQPGTVLRVPRRSNVPPIEAIQPPVLPEAVYHIQSALKEEMRDFGSLRQGSEGRTPTRDASGELVKELRANDDRYLSSPTNSIIAAIARMCTQWQTLLKFGWPEERFVAVAGDDQAARFRKVSRNMFKGNVHAVGVVESMLPESRQERQQRIDWWAANGLITPEHYFELINHPHLARAAHPGGVDKQMAEFENKWMLDGQPMIVMAFHDHAVHVEYHRRVMAAPEFMELDPAVQQVFIIHLAAHQEELALQVEAAQAMEAEAAQQEDGNAAGPAPQ